MAYRYEEIAQSLIGMIQSGMLKEGEKIPSLRQMSHQFGASLNTVKEAYERLEQWFYIRSEPQSGFYVRKRTEELKAIPAQDPAKLNPQEVSLCRIYSAFPQEGDEFPRSSLGIATLDPQWYPTAELTRIIKDVLKEEPDAALEYQLPPGYLPLREQLARLQMEEGLKIGADEILITNGCHEAIYLTLAQLCKAGDTVALESPCYFNLFQMLNQLGLKVIEIPAHPEEGIPLETLQFILDNYQLSAFITISNFSNPLGFSHSREKKKAILKLLQDKSVPLVEDDIYSELYWGKYRPESYMKLASEEQEVYLCSSLSKTTGPGLRLGWINHRGGVEELSAHKTLLNLGAPSLQQLALSRFLEEGLYHRHIRKVRRCLAKNFQSFRQNLLELFPKGTRVSQPQGGMVLWVSLPEEYFSMDLYRETLSRGILIAPGELFSQRRSYKHCFRLNFGYLPEDNRSLVEELASCLEKEREIPSR